LILSRLGQVLVTWESGIANINLNQFGFTAQEGIGSNNRITTISLRNFANGISIPIADDDLICQEWALTRVGILYFFTVYLT
jgi:hypothetical protein